MPQVEWGRDSNGNYTMNLLSKPVAAVLAVALLGPCAARAQRPGVLALAVDSTRWELDGQAQVTEYLGRKCLMLNGASAAVKGLEMRDGVINVDIATPASRGFFGIEFRVSEDGANGEWVYLRQHKSGLPDAVQ